MSETTETILLNIYNRIASKVQIDRLSAKVELFSCLNAAEQYSELVIFSDDGSLYVTLKLETQMSENKVENIDSYRWEYMDCNTGALYESDLNYNVTDEEVIEFFQHTLATDIYTNWRG